MTEEEIDAIPATKTIKLPKPIINNDAVEVSVLQLHEPDGLDILKIQKSGKLGAEADYFAIGVIAGVPENEVAKLPYRIIRRAADYIASFTQSAQRPTTTTTSA